VIPHKMITRPIGKLLFVMIALDLSGCCNVPAGNHTSHSIVPREGLGVWRYVAKRQLRRGIAAQPKMDKAADLRAANDLLLLADEADAKIGERISFERLDRALTICRGC
jgi:hypothetical protein